MTTAAPVSFPEPVAPSAAPAPQREAAPEEAPQFAALLDEHDPAEPLQTPALADVPAEPSSVANPPNPGQNIAVEIQGKIDPAPDSESEDVVEEKDEPEEKHAPTETATLSSQLAMWQILPRLVEPAPMQEKIAAPSSASTQSGETSEPIISSLPLTSAPPPNPAPAAWPSNSPEAPTAASQPAVLGQKLPVAAGAAGAIPLPSPIPTSTSTNPAAATQTVDLLVGKNLPEAANDAAPKARLSINGIQVAKQQRVMSDRDLQPTVSPATAGFAGVGAASASATQIAPVASTGGQKFQQQPHEEFSRQPETPAATSPFNLSESKPRQGENVAEFSAPVKNVEMTKVIEQIQHAVERLRVQGGQRIEMRLPLQDGGEVIVKLQVEAGQVKAIFRTESGGLRDALEAGWNQFSANAPERALKVGSVVFESPATQSGMGGFGNTPDQRSRQQAFAEAESLNTPAINFPTPKATLSTARPNPTPAHLSGLQLYA